MTYEVAVTGVGMVTPLGSDAKSTLAAWRAGASAKRARVPELAGSLYEGEEVATLPSPALDNHIRNRRLLKYASTAGLLGCIAAAEAAEDAGIVGRFAPERIGLYAGAGMTAGDVAEALRMVTNSLDDGGCFSARLLGSRGLNATNPLMAFKILPNMAPCLGSMMLNIRGPSLIFTPWEGQTAAALLEAWNAVAGGEVDCALAGGADEASNPASLVFLRHSGRLGADEFAAAAAAYVVFERLDTAMAPVRNVHCRVRRMTITPTESPTGDPLASRMGRMYAAAPAVLLALAALDHQKRTRISGVDRQEFCADLEAGA